MEEDDPARGMEERHGVDDHVVLGDAHQWLELTDVGDEVAVGEHDPLGQAGGAARIQQGGDIPGQIDRWLGGLGCSGEQSGEWGSAGRLDHSEYSAHGNLLRGAGRPLHLLRRGEQVPGAGILELIGQLVGGGHGGLWW